MEKHNIFQEIKIFYQTLSFLESAVKNGTKVTLNLSSSLTGNSNGETNFPHKLLLTYTQVSKIFKAFTNGSSTYINCGGLVLKIYLNHKFSEHRRV